MPQQTEIVEKEKHRNDLQQCRTARLYREGGFLRAYEWSAWLFVKYVSDFKVTCRMVKAVKQPVAMIGFPPASMTKFTPDGAAVEPQADGSIIVVFPSSAIPDDTDIQAFAAEYEEWKSALPVVEKKERETSESQPPFVPDAPHSGGTLTGIMQRILAYPIETKSPMESIAFLSEIKRQLSALI